MCNESFEACKKCAVKCLHEDDVKSMARCIELFNTCSHACVAAWLIISGDSKFSRYDCKMCVDVCNICAEECGKHQDMEHCKICAEVCHRCVEECRKKQEDEVKTNIIAIFLSLYALLFCLYQWRRSYLGMPRNMDMIWKKLLIQSFGSS